MQWWWRRQQQQQQQQQHNNEKFFICVLQECVSGMKDNKNKKKNIFFIETRRIFAPSPSAATARNKHSKNMSNFFLYTNGRLSSTDCLLDIKSRIINTHPPLNMKLLSILYGMASYRIKGKGKYYSLDWSTANAIEHEIDFLSNFVAEMNPQLFGTIPARTFYVYFQLAVLLNHHSLTFRHVYELLDTTVRTNWQAETLTRVERSVPTETHRKRKIMLRDNDDDDADDGEEIPMVKVVQMEKHIDTKSENARAFREGFYTSAKPTLTELLDHQDRFATVASAVEYVRNNNNNNNNNNNDKPNEKIGETPNNAKNTNVQTLAPLPTLPPAKKQKILESESDEFDDDDEDHDDDDEDDQENDDDDDDDDDSSTSIPAIDEDEPDAEKDKQKEQEEKVVPKKPVEHPEVTRLINLVRSPFVVKNMPVVSSSATTSATTAMSVPEIKRIRAKTVVSDARRIGPLDANAVDKPIKCFWNDCFRESPTLAKHREHIASHLGKRKMRAILCTDPMCPFAAKDAEEMEIHMFYQHHKPTWRICNLKQRNGAYCLQSDCEKYYTDGKLHWRSFPNLNGWKSHLRQVHDMDQPATQNAYVNGFIIGREILRGDDLAAFDAKNSLVPDNIVQAQVKDAKKK